MAIQNRLAETTPQGITGRETEILNLLKSGNTSQSIANRLHISERTVKFHIGNILRKLQAKNRLEAVVLALREGLIT